jgi:hypothetical protein
MQSGFLDPWRALAQAVKIRAPGLFLISNLDATGTRLAT